MLGNAFIDKYFRLKDTLSELVVRISMIRSRRIAHKKRKTWIKDAGKSVVNRDVKKQIKRYAQKRFGSSAFWPYLALNTEIRGEFKEGWIPDDYYRYVMEPRINPPAYSSVSEQKTFDYQLWGDFAVRPLFLCISGRYYDADLKVLDPDFVKKFLDDYNNDMVVKEEFTMGGKSVQVVHSSEFNLGKLLKGRSYVIQPYIKQHKIINDLYPGSVNTIRVITFINGKGMVEVKYTILRFGIDGSRVDNLSSGGQFLYIDASGKPSEYAYNTNGYNSGKKHKNTEYTFADLRIPVLDEIKRKCIEAHKKYPYVRLVGWDICYTESEELKLIEWNALRPGIEPIDTIFGPFWKDDEL
jgi:hypothetical protein